MAKSKIFPQSEELAGIIEAKGWNLFDIPKFPDRAATWEEINKLKPSRGFALGKDYMFTPQLRPGQSLRDAYAVTRGLGPCMRLDNLTDHTNMDGIGAKIFSGKLTYFFSRLFFDVHRGRNVVVATTPQTPLIDHPPVLIIPWEYSLEKFRNFFGIMTPEEYRRGLETMQPAGDFHMWN